jgi:XisI protein
LGWQDNRQVCMVIFHFTIQNGKIWLHRNVADYDILKDLDSYGIPKDDIVLAFQPPQIRQYTGYAVA